MKTIGYVRVSTEQQAKEGVSIDNQIERIKSYCDYKGYELTEVIKDEGISGGKNKEREGFVNILNRIEQNGCDAIVLYSLERISRDMLTPLCLERLLNEYDVELHTIEGEIDTSTPDGYMSFAMRAFLGEMERRQVKYRTKKAMEYKKQKGEVVGSIPYGFARKGKDLIPVEKEQEIIRIINRLYKQGKGIAAIARKLTKLNYKTRRSKEFSALQVRRIIRGYQPVYNHNGRKAREIRKFILSVA